MKDLKVICKTCETAFFLSEGELEFFRSKDWQIPKRCKPCRKSNRSNEESPASMQNPLFSGSNTSSAPTVPWRNV